MFDVIIEAPRERGVCVGTDVCSTCLYAGGHKEMPPGCCVVIYASIQRPCGCETVKPLQWKPISAMIRETIKQTDPQC